MHVFRGALALSLCVSFCAYSVSLYGRRKAAWHSDDGVRRTPERFSRICRRIRFRWRERVDGAGGETEHAYWGQRYHAC